MQDKQLFDYLKNIETEGPYLEIVWEYNDFFIIVNKRDINTQHCTNRLSDLGLWS